MKKHSTARRVLALGLNLTLAGVPAWLWADEEPTELPALTVSAGAPGKPRRPSISTTAPAAARAWA